MSAPLTFTAPRHRRNNAAKGRMVKHYFVDTDGGGAWWGDCPKWAEAAKRSGQTVRVVNVLRFGPPEPCGACEYGLTH